MIIKINCNNYNYLIMFMKEMELLNKNELVYKDEMGIN